MEIKTFEKLPKKGTKVNQGGTEEEGKRDEG